MTIYFLNAFSVLFYAFLDLMVRTNRKGQLERANEGNPGGVSKYVFGLLIIQEILFLGLRAPTVGVDTIGYVEKFLNTKRINDSWEPLFVLFVKLMNWLTDSATIYLILVAAVCVIPISVVIYKLSAKPFLSWYVYICMNYYSFAFSGLRQSMAAGFLAIALLMLVRKKYIKSVIFIVVASGFHLSALVFLIAPFVRNHRWKPTQYFLLALLYAFVFFFRRQIFTRIVVLVYDQYDVIQTGAYSWMLFNMLLLLLLFALSARIKDDDVLNFSLNLMAVGGAFLLLTSVGDNVLRIANYFTVFMTVAIPNSLKRIEKRIVPAVVFLGVIILTYFYYRHLRADPFAITPYTSIFENMRKA